MEIPFLLEQFDKILVIPSRNEGHLRPLFNRVEYVSTLATALDKNVKALNLKRIFQGINSNRYWREYIAKLPITIHPKSLKRSALWATEALLTGKWVEQFIMEHYIKLSKCIFYTYWFETITTGIGWLKAEYPQIFLVSRAQGYDLYEERYSPAYIPFREESLRALTQLFINSDSGNYYLGNKYPIFKSKFKTSRKGVFSTNVLNRPSRDSICRIVSCSNIVSVKRVDLMFEGIRHLASSHSDNKFEWNHFGDGSCRKQVTTLIQNAPINLKVTLSGSTPNEHILDYYRNAPIDIFINTSSSEGVPISIMEAQSFGIPVIATGVGGIPEIVNNENGTLLPSDPTSGEIAAAIWDLYTADNYQQKRAASLENWRKKFNAEKNYRQFAQEIRAILDS